MKNLRQFVVLSIIILLIATGLTAGYATLLKMKRMADARGFQLPMRKLVAELANPKTLFYVSKVIIDAAPTIGKPEEVTLRTEQNAITINRPVDVVFDFFVDPQKMKLWIAGLESIDELSQGPMEKGAKYVAFYKLMGSRFQLVGVVDEFVPFKKMRVLMDHSDFSANISFEFIEHNKATTILHSMQASTNSGTMMIAAGMVAYQADLELSKDLENLQKIIESRY